MSTTVEQWKAQIESEVRNNIEKFISLPEISSAVASAELSSKPMDFKTLGRDAKLTFASDEAIQKYLDNPKTFMIDGLCCLLCIDTPLVKACASPHMGGPCNMC
ncbi:hypothetical protein J2Y39_000980 [Pseudomonas sp. 2957]|uniref:hypothetical protein n=1 Tax=Pseudomonas sp. 2957 TaxID=2817766 RepID=UPI0028604EC8|nr:hypothetical protein [Pseudomonas sp. 2957]MDR6946400.1 hypothetical protein [Pseudomonas sp. 2957]